MQLVGRRGVRSMTANATNTSFEIDLVANYQLASSRVRAIDSTSLQQLGPRCALEHAVRHLDIHGLVVILQQAVAGWSRRGGRGRCRQQQPDAHGVLLFAEN